MSETVPEMLVPLREIFTESVSSVQKGEGDGFQTDLHAVPVNGALSHVEKAFLHGA